MVATLSESAQRAIRASEAARTYDAPDTAAR